jgi:hypothetical protein
MYNKKMKSTARRHHYLPQAYLASFTRTGQKGDQFFIFDVQSGSSFCTSPLNIAVEKDFNRIDIEGVPIDAIESELSHFEEQAIKAIRDVIESETFPDGESFNLILNLLGLIAVHNPRFRKAYNKAREQTIHNINDILISDKKILDYHIRKVRESGKGYQR